MLMVEDVCQHDDDALLQIKELNLAEYEETQNCFVCRGKSWSRKMKGQTL